MPKFSVVVPVYKVEAFLPQCIESLQQQTLHDIEIILVDDGSPDRCGEICDEYAAKDGRIRVIHKPNAGVSAARNDGIAVATGEYIIFCDSDDWMEPDAFERLYDKGVETNADIVIGDVNRVFGDRKELAVFYAKEFASDDRIFLDKLIQADFYRTYCPIPARSGSAFGYGGPWNKAVKLELLEKNDIRFDLRVKGIFDDIIYTAYILTAANRVAYIQGAVYNYRQISTSITSTYKSNMPEINAAIFTAWQEFIAKYGSQGQFGDPYHANVVRRLAESLPNYYFNPNNPNTLKKKLDALQKVLQTEPYHTAALRVDKTKLQCFHAALAVLMRMGNAGLIYVLYKTKEIIKKALRR